MSLGKQWADGVCGKGVGSNCACLVQQEVEDQKCFKYVSWGWDGLDSKDSSGKKGSYRELKGGHTTENPSLDCTNGTK